MADRHGQAMNVCKKGKEREKRGGVPTHKGFVLVQHSLLTRRLAGRQAGLVALACRHSITVARAFIRISFGSLGSKEGTHETNPLSKPPNQSPNQPRSHRQSKAQAKHRQSTGTAQVQHRQTRQTRQAGKADKAAATEHPESVPKKRANRPSGRKPCVFICCLLAWPLKTSKEKKT